MKLTLDLRSYHSDNCTHQHDFHQLVLPVHGHMEMEIDNDDSDVTTNQVAIIPAQTEHSFMAHSDSRFIVADVPIALAPELAKLPPFIKMDEGLSHYVLFLQHELHQHKSHTHLMANHNHNQHQMLILMIHLLTERYGEVLKIDKRLEAARQFLDSRIGEPVTLAEVALLSHLSIRQLTALFRRYFDMSPQQYLLEQRMQLAWRLLSQTRTSVQTVAEQCGYSNLSAFSNRFSRHFGCAPSHVRGNTAESANN